MPHKRRGGAGGHYTHRVALGDGGDGDTSPTDGGGNRGSVAVATAAEGETSVAEGCADEDSLSHGAPVASRSLPPEEVAFSERVDRILTERREAGTPVSLEEAERLALEEELAESGQS